MNFPNELYEPLLKVTKEVMEHEDAILAAYRKAGAGKPRDGGISIAQVLIYPEDEKAE